MSGVKRKRHVVTMDQKLKAIERLDKGASVKSISDELGVGVTTVKDWKRNKKSIQDYCTQIESEKILSSRCTLKKPTNEIVDDALWLWFTQERRKGTPISGPILKEKAMALHSKIENCGTFTASDGWLARWKKRHGVHFISVCGEKLSADPAAAAEWIKKLNDVITKEGLHPEQVYNMDETGLNFKRLPDKTFATSSEKSAPGFKIHKERITVALCSNSTGTHKLKPLVIGKAQKPRAFKNVNISSLPVCYKNQKSAWMDEYIFKDWLVNNFVPSVKNHLKILKMPCKAILIVDNAPTHPEGIKIDGESGIQCLFLPPHVTSLIQPMDQGVIECFKRRYRRKLISEILNRMDLENKGLIFALKSINIKDVIYMVATSYEEVPSSTIVKSWRKAWPEVEKTIDDHAEDNPMLTEGPHDQLEPDDNVTLLNELQRIPDMPEIQENDVGDWLATCDDELENEFLTDEEIVQNLLKEREDGEARNEEEEEEDEEDDEGEKISHVEARNALQLAALYIEQQQTSTAVDVMFIKKWRDYAFKMAIKGKKQKKITDFFG